LQQFWSYVEISQHGALYKHVQFSGDYVNDVNCDTTLKHCIVHVKTSIFEPRNNRTKYTYR